MAFSIGGVNKSCDFSVEGVSLDVLQTEAGSPDMSTRALLVPAERAVRMGAAACVAEACGLRATVNALLTVTPTGDMRARGHFVCLDCQDGSGRPFSVASAMLEAALPDESDVPRALEA
jgi:hypothetical protein